MSAAQSLGFDLERRSNIGIVATEAANNAFLHAGGGQFLICPGTSSSATWLDLIALDSGPGIRYMGRAMEDGYSTIGTAGQGLGAIKRLSDASSLYSSNGKGTANWSRFETGSAPNSGVVCLPIREETIPGDSYLIHTIGRTSIYMMVDGLGHGSGATEAADEAVKCVTHSLQESPAEIIRRAHGILKATRGAAMAVAVVDTEKWALTYAGVGNISAMLVSGSSSKGLVSQNGTVGAILPSTVQEYTSPIESNAMLIMFSDGLTSKTNLNAYAGFQNRHPMLLAGLLYRDFRRLRDDSTVMVAPLRGY
jgi:anti-sigma regulatory factor (Ser/Thr protein kinase)